MLWAQDNRSSMIKDLNLTNAETSKLLGQKWKTLSNEEKQPYKDKAEQIKCYHKAKYPNYIYTPKKKIGNIKTIKTIKTKYCKKKKLLKN